MSICSLFVYLLTDLSSETLLTKRHEELYLDQKRRELEDLLFAQHRRKVSLNETRLWKSGVDISFLPEIDHLFGIDKKTQESATQLVEQLKLRHQLNFDHRKANDSKNKTDSNTVTKPGGNDEFLRKANALQLKINMLYRKIEQQLSRQPNSNRTDSAMYGDIQMQKEKQSGKDMNYPEEDFIGHFHNKKPREQMFKERLEYDEEMIHLKVGTEANLTYHKTAIPQQNAYKHNLTSTYKVKSTASPDVTKMTINQNKNGKQLKAKSVTGSNEHKNNITQNNPKTPAVKKIKSDFVLKLTDKKDTSNLLKPGSNKVAKAGEYLGDEPPVTDMPNFDVTPTVEDLQMLGTGNHLLILSYMRSGSSMNGDVFKDGDEDFYVYEPLIKFAPYHYFTENRLCRMRKPKCR